MAPIDDTPVLPPSPKRFWQRRKRWLALMFFAGMLCIVALAPTLVATMPPLLQAVVEASALELKGEATVGGASLGWFAPVVVRDVVWRDTDGKPLAEVPAVRLERTLWQLLGNRTDIGVIHLDQPRLKVVLRDDGSNVEDAAQRIAAKFSQASSSAVALEVHGASIELVDSTQDLAWQIQEVDATLAMPSDPQAPSQCTARGLVHDTQGIARTWDANYTWHAVPERPQPGQPGSTLELKTREIPLAMLRALVRRAVPNADLNGVASCDLQLSTSADGSQQQLKVARLQAQDLLFVAPQFTGTEALHTRQLSAQGDVQLHNGRVKLTGVKFDTDFAHGEADGQLPLAAWQQSTSEAAIAALQNEDYVVRGELDLARLAALFPQTLRIREGTDITAGKVTLQLISQIQGKRRRWDGELKTSQLVATQGGREIVWDEPITVTLAAQQSSIGPVIERLACNSSFLTLQARGTLADGEVTASGDLAQLLTEANRFVNLDDISLNGKLAGTMGWRRQAESAQARPIEQEELVLQGQATISGFELITPGQEPWREPQLTLDIAAVGQMRGAALEVLDTASVRAVAADDLLQVELTDAIPQPLQQTAWPITCVMRGDLARWLPRVKTWLPVAVERAAGATTLNAAMVSTSQGLEVSSLKLDVIDLRLETMGMTISEPEVHLTGDKLWTNGGQRFQAESIALATSALACRGDRVVIEPRASGVAISGDLGYQAKLDLLSNWFTPAGTTPPRKWSGNTVGRIKFTHQGNVTQGKWTAEFEKLALAQPRKPAGVVQPIAAPSDTWEVVFREPKLSWHGQGEFDHVRNRLVASHLNVSSDKINVVARGQIDSLTTAPVVDLAGEIVYDLQNVATILGSYLGDGLKMSGADKRQFVLRGPLPTYASFSSQDPRAPAVQKLVWPKELVGRGGIGWNSAEIYGLPLGPTNIEGALENGIINFAPIDVQVATGRLKAWPRLVLGNDPMVFQLAKGTSAEQIEITPQMCQTWLKFVAPLLADATQAQGKFSATVDGATFPLVTPEAGEARGVLTVHGARVGPGKVSEPYVVLARNIRLLLERKAMDPNFRADSVEWLTLPQQDVQVEMKGGRVYHRGLQIQVQDTLLLTSGSVGADQSLSLIVEVPIREEWIAKDRVLSALRGQSLKVPVGGTVAQPKIDARALDQIAGQLFQNAAGNLIESGLQQGLDKLLRPKNP